MNRVHVAYRVSCMLIILIATLTACTSASPGAVSLSASPSARTTTVSVTSPTEEVATPEASPREPAFYSRSYRNLFREYLGKTDEEVQQKLNTTWQHLFYGDDESQRVYYPVGADMAYILDVASGDVRTEGMSYGMMIAVQMNKKEEFDRLWTWVRTHMYQSEGPYRGYFVWRCAPDGRKLDSRPAPDGEIWFATALLFAAHRWGNERGIFNYHNEAQRILDIMIHKDDEHTGLATSMFNRENKLVVLFPGGRQATLTNPSYHLPAYYELWSRWAERDNDFWAEAARASRAFLRRAAHPQTGLMPNYSTFDGTPTIDPEHKQFRFDAWRTLSNVAVDYAWFGADPWQVEQSNRVLQFFLSQGVDTFVNQYTLDGKPLSRDRSPGLLAMTAVAALAADRQYGEPFVREFWSTPVPSGESRYYDGMLYMLGLLHASGHFRIYFP
jgi:oligosaccharide reducing-end xylanase